MEQFRKMLDKQDRKKFDDMLTIPHLYTVAGTMVARPVLSHVILMSIIFEHRMQLSRNKNSLCRQFQKKLESIGIIIDIDKLMKS